MRFLSADNVLRHKEFLKELKLKYSVLEKSYPEINDRTLSDIIRLHLGHNETKEILDLSSKILMHELYFNSFSEELCRSEAVRKYFGSEANFLYEIEREISSNEGQGFLLVFCDRKNQLSFKSLNDFSNILLSSIPLLSIDLYEHAYFLDYGFERKRYVKNALSHLNLNKINDFYKTY